MYFLPGGREMASEQNMLKRDGGAYPKSGGHSTLMPTLPALYLLLSPVCCSAPSLPSLLAARLFPTLARCPRQTDQTAPLGLDRPDSSD